MNGMKKRIDDLNMMKLLVLKHNVKALCTYPKKTFSGFVSEGQDKLSDFYVTNEYRLSNDFYGIASALKNVMHRSKPLHAFIEHGVYFGDYTNDEEIGGLMPALFTFSDTRRRHIRGRSAIPVFCIGPYIHYADPFYNEEIFSNIKKRYGKILLAFPQHSIEGVSIQSDGFSLENQLKRIKKEGDFDSVFVCLYYRELLSGLAEYYRGLGFIPVCAGNRQDPHFLCRLKSFILLSDFTVSDNIGTHIGYCESLNRKHLVVKTGNRLTVEDRNVMGNVPELYLNSAVCEKREVEAAFSVYDHFDERKRLVDKYWGSSHILSPEQLAEIANFLDSVYRFSKKHKVDYLCAFTELMDTQPNIRKLCGEAIHGC